MKDSRSNISLAKARRLSLEQKILRLARRYRAAEKRRQQKQPAPLKTRRRSLSRFDVGSSKLDRGLFPG